MIRVAILDDYQRVAPGFADWSALGPDVEIDVFDAPVPQADAARILAPYTVICAMRERMALGGALIGALPNLRLIVFTGPRISVIDIEAARARGVTVCHTRGGDSLHSTSELAWGLILSLARRIPDEHAGMRAGRWQETVGVTLAGRTLGLVGLGRLGQRMVPVARAFGMNVIAWSPNLTSERAAAAGVRHVDREALFAEADIVSIHMVLAAATRGIVGRDDIARMKPGAYLVNTSRGPLVDETALLEALHAGRIAGAGLDVYDIEPLPPGHALRAAPNVVLTPHLGYVSERTYREFHEDMVEAIAAWRSGSPVRVYAP